jgi:integrase
MTESDRLTEIQPWNKGRLVGKKRPLKSRDVWTIHTRLELHGNKRDLALFNLAIDSKLRACDLVSIRVSDIQTADRVRERARVIQKKTGRPVQLIDRSHSFFRDGLAWCLPLPAFGLSVPEPR